MHQCKERDDEEEEADDDGGHDIDLLGDHILGMVTSNQSWTRAQQWSVPSPLSHILWAAQMS